MGALGRLALCAEGAGVGHRLIERVMLPRVDIWNCFLRYAGSLSNRMCAMTRVH
jgi:hypothetical protein